MDLRSKRALVMGLGVHGGGLGVARFLVGQGADVTITDLRGPDLLKPSIDALAGLPIRYVLGEHREQDFRAADLVIRNPGVPRESRYLQIARIAGAAIEMEMTLFFRLCPGPILGITGTKGKTTTTLLAGAMLREQYPDTVVAGNLRVSALEALPRITASTPVVLELSSWQLEGLGEAHLSPQYACVTNISPDHLNRYGSMVEYAEAKKQIFLWQGEDGVVILHHDDPEIVMWAHEAPGSVAWFGAASSEIHTDTQSWVFYNQAGLWWASQRTGKRHIQHLCTLEDIPLAGDHNIANVAAATALAKSFGVSNKAIEIAIREFKGIEHRLEFVRELDGIRYINDTTATAPEATIAALRSFEAPVVLIAGGADKNLPFDVLARAIVEHTKAVVLLRGTATPKLQSAISNQQSAVSRSKHPADCRLPTVAGPFDDFVRAIDTARELAEAGDVVLLSPGCASFGMFRNEFHRGDEFKRIVNQF
ncbi:MAG TPA: UDP-N-acetylmuramoyl-L-alanine--D-glutamate ligase [Roseiflexaceae bacterium]